MIQVEMLGHLRISEPETGVDAQINVAGRGHQIWELIVYLILHRDRTVSVHELVDKFCAESDGDSPADTIKNRISRARAMLSRLGLSDAKSLIRCTDGHYFWGREITLDLDELERLATEDVRDPNAVGDLGLRAVSLYGGHFIPALSYPWAAPLSAYYHSLFVKLALRALQHLEGLGRWNDLGHLANRAFDLDPSVEEFSVALIHFFAAKGLPQKAQEHFAQVRRSMMEQYGVSPSPELELAYLEAMKPLYGGRLTKPALQSFFKENHAPGAFYCDCNTFREVTLLCARIAQDGQPESQLLAITLEMSDPHALGLLSAHMEQIESVLCGALRQGDAYTKLSTDRLLVLLPDTSPGDVLKVADRILARFHNLYPGAGARFRYNIYDLASLELV